MCKPFLRHRNVVPHIKDNNLIARKRIMFLYFLFLWSLKNNRLTKADKRNLKTVYYRFIININISIYSYVVLKHESQATKAHIYPSQRFPCPFDLFWKTSKHPNTNTMTNILFPSGIPTANMTQEHLIKES